MADLTTRLYKEQTDESKKFQNEQLAAYQKQISVLTSRLTNQYESMIPAEVDTKVHLSQSETVNKNEYDVFISHATEDKESFANELYRILTEEYGFKVWYDVVAMKWGDSLRTQIDNGLKHQSSVLSFFQNTILVKAGLSMNLMVFSKEK